MLYECSYVVHGVGRIANGIPHGTKNNSEYLGLAYQTSIQYLYNLQNSIHHFSILKCFLGEVGKFQIRISPLAIKFPESGTQHCGSEHFARPLFAYSTSNGYSIFALFAGGPSVSPMVSKIQL